MGSYRIHSWKVKKILQEKMSRHSDEYNPMLDDYNDPEFNSYTSQGFKTTKSSKSGGLIDRAQNPTYELHISRIPRSYQCHRNCSHFKRRSRRIYWNLCPN